MEIQSFFYKRKTIAFLLLSLLCGIIDYWICDFVAWVNNLPLFCDTIFIMAVSFIAGPWWGVLAGFFYHLFDILISGSIPLGHIFILCHFAAALLAGYFKLYVIKESDSGWILFIKVLVLSLLMCLAMSVSGGLVSYLLSHIEAYNAATSQTDFLTFLWQNNIESKLLLMIIVRLPVNLADRILCVFAAWGIFLLSKKAIPARIFC